MMLRGLLWRTAFSVLVLIDYFLFSTGNPSLTFSMLGGWFIFPLLLVAVLAITYCATSFATRLGRKYLACYAAILVAVAAILYPLSRAARSHAEARLASHLHRFVSNPATQAVIASKETRALMTQVAKGKYSIENDGFIPTFRRIDYQLTSDIVGALTLVLTMQWDGTPEVVILRPTE